MSERVKPGVAAPGPLSWASTGRSRCLRPRAAPGGSPRSIEDFAQFVASRGALRLEDLEVLSTVRRSVNFYINPCSPALRGTRWVSPLVLRSAADKTRAGDEAHLGDPNTPGMPRPMWATDILNMPMMASAFVPGMLAKRQPGSRPGDLPIVRREPERDRLKRHNSGR